MKIADTTFLIDLLRGKEEVLSIMKGAKQLYTTQINMFELLRGLFLRNISSAKMQEVIEVMAELRVFPLEDSSVVKSAHICSTLIKEGSTIPDADCLIAGIALVNGVKTIITKDSEHFGRIQDIQVESY